MKKLEDCNEYELTIQSAIIGQELISNEVNRLKMKYEKETNKEEKQKLWKMLTDANNLLLAFNSSVNDGVGKIHFFTKRIPENINDEIVAVAVGR